MMPVEKAITDNVLDSIYNAYSLAINVRGNAIRRASNMQQACFVFLKENSFIS